MSMCQVGVHIADVTAFLRHGSVLDQEALERGTTVYLVDRRIEMLPSLLTSNLCSLKGERSRALSLSRHHCSGSSGSRPEGQV